VFRKYSDGIIDYKEELQIMRENFKQKKEKTLKLKRPDWLDNDDKLNRIYAKMDLLLQEGEVYWGSLVQANEILFRKRPHIDCPCNVVFTSNEYLNHHPQMMSTITRQIFSYKNTNNAPKYLKRIVAYVTNEVERVFNYPISVSEVEELGKHMTASQEDTLYFTTMIVFRKYIPGGVLTSSVFPIVAAPGVTDISIILPKKYWTKKVTRMFLNK